MTIFSPGDLVATAEVDVHALPHLESGGLRAIDAPRIGERIGEGGMGVVLEGHDDALGRTVAIKRLRDNESRDGPKLRALVREARIMAQLAHPHVVPVYTLARDPVADSAYFTMQRVEGESLATFVAQARAQHRHEQRDYLLDVVDVAIRLCDVLALAHDRGVVHCDVTPANVLLARYGCVYLIDWGIARVGDEWDLGGRFAGTPAFCAPEQLAGGHIDPRADLFGVGSLLFFALTGQPPVRAKTTLAALALHEEHGLPRIADLCGRRVVPGRLAAAIDRCLSASPADRFANADALKAELVACSRGEHEPKLESRPAGTVILREGEACVEPHACAYLIRSGTCSVIRGNQQVRTMGPGEVFGEAGVLCLLARRENSEIAPAQRSATVVANDDVVLERLGVDEFSEAVTGMKHGIERFLFALARRFVETR